MILLVEDSIDHTDILSIIIEGFGYEVVSTSSGHRGLAIAKALGSALELVLLDLWLPDCDKEWLGLQLRELPLPAPIVLMSACPPHELTASATRIGVAHYLQKPYDTETLKNAIRTFSRPRAIAAGLPPTKTP